MKAIDEGEQGKHLRLGGLVLSSRLVVIDAAQDLCLLQSAWGGRIRGQAK